MATHTLTVNNTSLAVQTCGSGQPVVLLHAFPLDHDMWQRVLPLADHLRLIIPDLRGFGRSAGAAADPPAPLSIAQLADDVAGLLEALHVSEPAVIVGVSMGGYVAQHLAVRHPERVSRLVLVDTKFAADTPEALSLIHI